MVDDKLYLTSGPRARKSRNLAAEPRCAVSVALGDMDLVLEGTASKVTDEATVADLAERYAAQGWPAGASHATDRNSGAQWQPYLERREST
jgi:hypothetical protein